MKIYGQTDEIVVREMTENDCGQYLKLMTQLGMNEDFTIADIQVLWEYRKEHGDVQCTITSIDGKTIYGFCGIVHSKLCTDIFDEYSGRGHDKQARGIIEHLEKC